MSGITFTLFMWGFEMKEHKIGETFPHVVDGVEVVLRVVEQRLMCTGCVGQNRENGHCSELSFCTDDRRKDGENVIFELVPPPNQDKK